MSEQVLVQGFHWCPQPKLIGLSGLTAKILCAKHNSDLSELDTAGSKAFAAMREMMRLSNIRAKLKPRNWTVQRYKIDGPKLERWFLKTLINLSIQGEYFIGLDSIEVGRPSKTLVEICFGVRQFRENAGLYSVAQVGQEIKSKDTVKFGALLKYQKYVAGGFFSFRGNRYLLFLEEVSRPELPRGVGLQGEDWSPFKLNFHNRSIREMAGKHLSQVLETIW